MGVSTAILIGLVYWISQAKVWYGFSIMRMPLSIAPIMGIIFDDMPTALSVGATLQMIYIGSIALVGTRQQMRIGLLHRYTYCSYCGDKT